MNIENRLKQSESVGAKSALLNAQWSFDKELIGRSLNSVSLSYPHYSLHDVSHSKSIISEIEKILGDKVDNLSYVDCWLLLEASYWHDVGMIITNEEKKTILNDKDFQNFITTLSDEQTEMGKFARLFQEFERGNTKVNFLDIEHAFTFLIAEFIRKVHPSRSRKAVENPLDIGILTPRSGLINNRLFSILGDIIECHGKDSAAILELPYENDGLESGDIAHPRFIASMLRIGDLLDLDDGRHCPTLLKAIGDIPQISQAHFDKHRSVVSKTVNPFVIEIQAICKDFESYEAQSHWLRYLELEVEFQDKHWGSIAPTNSFGKLPTIKMLSCEIDGNMPLSTRGSRLRIDENRIYSYMTGEGIYKDKYSGISEILQNAVDAISRRIWNEHGSEQFTLAEYRRLAENYPIDIDVVPIIEDQSIVYNVSITDSGTGMSLSDIKKLTTIASTGRHNDHIKTELSMPEWMRPSGFFGIGMQSIFSLCDTFKLTTKSPSDSCYEVTLKSYPKQTPSFMVKKIDRSPWRFGTTASFQIVDVLIPDSFSGRAIIDKEFKKFDPLRDNHFKVKEYQIYEHAIEFAKYCDFPIRFNGKEIKRKKGAFPIYDEIEGIEYELEFMLNAHLCNWAYRGRKFETKMHYTLFGINGNIISGHANSYLPLNRESLHESGKELLSIKIERSLKNKQKEIFESIQNKPLASLYYHLQDLDINDEWRNQILSGCRAEDFLSPGRIYDFAIGAEHYSSGIEVDGNIPLIKSEEKIIVDLLHKHKRGVEIISITKSRAEIPHFPIPSGRDINIYRIKVLDGFEHSTISSDAYNFLAGEKLSSQRSRYWLPCNASKFPDISIDCKQINNWIIGLTPFHKLFTHGIVFPAQSIDDPSELLFLAKWIAEHAARDQRNVQNALSDFFNTYKFRYAEDSKSHFWDDDD